MLSSWRSYCSRAARSASSPCGPLGVQPALQLIEPALQLVEPRLQPLLDAAHRGSVRGRGLLGLGELALQPLDAQQQLASIILAGAQP